MHAIAVSKVIETDIFITHAWSVLFLAHVERAENDLFYIDAGK